MTQEEDNEAIIRRFFGEVYNAGNEHVLDEIIDPSYRDRGHMPPGEGIEGAHSDFRGARSAFDQVHFVIGDMFACGDRVAVRWTGQARHSGTFAGIPPTGKQVNLQGISLYRLKDGKLVETDNQQDLMGLLEQIGALPSAPVLR